MRKKGLPAILAMVFLLLHTFPLAGDELDQTALRGLKGVSVLVEGMNPLPERLGPTKTQIQTDVELRLRKAGVRVLTKKEWGETPGNPLLYVNVNILFLQKIPLVVYHISVVLNETVTLARGFEHVGSIWGAGFTGAVGMSNIGAIRKDVGDQVDKFINDYLAANPK